MLKFSILFSDRAVLQRGRPLPVWGADDSGETVTVRMGGFSASAKVTDGKWQAVLPAFDAQRGLTLTAENNLGETAVCRDIAVGEVWIAAGQSNMEFLLGCDARRDEVLTSFREPELRFIEIPKVSYPGQEEYEFHGDEGFWRKAEPGQLEYFSAAGFWFAKKLREYLGDVPVGIVGCNWGGTSAACWMTDRYLTDELEFYIKLREDTVAAIDVEQELRLYRDDHAKTVTPEAKAGMMKFLQNELKAPMPDFSGDPGFKHFMTIKYAPFSPFTTETLYHTMLERIIPCACAGVLWYQGEEDAVHAELYLRLFGQMVRCWRDSWGVELPFIQAQLAAYDPGIRDDLNFVPIRDVQNDITKEIPGVYFVCTMDAGMKYDIHPKDKLPVGERMAAQAAKNVYGIDVPCESPEPLAAEKDDGVLRVRLLHCENGLVIRGERAQALTLTVNGRPAEFTAECAGDTLTLRSGALRRNSRIRLDYAREPFCEPNLYNGDGLPVRPFRAEL